MTAVLKQIILYPKNTPNLLRDIAARFRGNLAGYRTIFTHVLDENRSGCVESDELNSLVLGE